MIVCASRRTDIPAFHSEWLMNRLRAGYALVRNPMERNVVYRVDLTRSNVDCLFFLTKDPRNLEPHLKEIGSMGHMYVFNITLNPYGRDLEPGVPFKADINDSCIRISEHIGRDRMAWRYDPIIFNHRHGIDYHRRKFDLLCREASQWTDRCIVSFVSMYGKLSSLEDDGLLRQVTRKEMVDFARMASKVSEEYGVSISQCCGSMSLEEYGIDDRGCFDSAWMNSLNIPYDTSSSPIRRGCRCVKSIDIGQYDTCLHDCAYCYANSIERSSRVSRTYDPGAEILWGDVMPSDTVVDLRSRDVARLDEFVHNV